MVNLPNNKDIKNATSSGLLTLIKDQSFQESFCFYTRPLQPPSPASNVVAKIST
jgi:hypothetical protein